MAQKRLSVLRQGCVKDRFSGSVPLLASRHDLVDLDLECGPAVFYVRCLVLLLDPRASQRAACQAGRVSQRHLRQHQADADSLS